MKIVSWNCRGLGSRKKSEAMRDLIRISNPDILLIQETIMEEEEFLQTSQMFWKYGEGTVRSARGSSGGIGTVWKKVSFELVQSLSHTHWILSILHHKEYGT